MVVAVGEHGPLVDRKANDARVAGSRKRIGRDCRARLGTARRVLIVAETGSQDGLP